MQERETGIHLSSGGRAMKLSNGFRRLAPAAVTAMGRIVPDEMTIEAIIDFLRRYGAAKNSVSGGINLWGT
jgi:hypothetical protein